MISNDSGGGVLTPPWPTLSFLEGGFPSIGKPFGRYVPEGEPAEVRLLPLSSRSEWLFPWGVPLCDRFPPNQSRCVPEGVPESVGQFHDRTPLLLFVLELDEQICSSDVRNCFLSHGALSVTVILAEVGFLVGEPFGRLFPEGEPAEVRLLPLVSRPQWRIPWGVPFCVWLPSTNCWYGSCVSCC